MAGATEESSKQIIKQLNDSIAQDKTFRRYTFPEFLDYAALHPERVLRTAYQYAYQAINSFGIEEVVDCGKKLFKLGLADDPFFNGLLRIVGQLRPQDDIYRKIAACANETTREGLILCWGPPGTGKSHFWMLVQKAMEEFSHTDKGAIFTHRWLFPYKGEFDKDLLGFGARKKCRVDSAGDRADCDSIECKKKDNPLLIIPSKYRQAMIEEFIEKGRASLKRSLEKTKDDGLAERLARLEDIFVPKKLIVQEACSNCLKIRDILLEKYDKNWTSMLRHVQVFNFPMSLSKGCGLAEVGPQYKTQAHSSLVKLDNAPEILAALNAREFFHMEGPMIDANRGFIDFENIFDGPYGHEGRVDLLSAVGEHRINVGGATQDIDVIIAGTTNIGKLTKLKQDLDAEGFKDRIDYIRWSHLLNYKFEQQIPAREIAKIRKTHHVAPHTITMGALFAVLTRLGSLEIRGALKAYFDRQQEIVKYKQNINADDAETLAGHLMRQRAFIVPSKKNETRCMTLLEQAKLYAGDLSWLDNEDKPLMTNEFMNALREYAAESEGMSAESDSPRELERMLGKLTKNADIPCISPFDVFYVIEKEHYGFMAVNEQKIHDAMLLQWMQEKGIAEEQLPEYKKTYLSKIEKRNRALQAVKEEYNDLAISELEEAIFAVAHDDVIEKAEEYLQLLKQHKEREQVKHPYSGEKVSPETLLKQHEKKLGLEGDAAKEYRDRIFNAYSAYAQRPESQERLKRDNKPIPVWEGVPDLVKDYKDAHFAERRQAFEYDGFMRALAKVEEAINDSEKGLAAMCDLDPASIDKNDTFVKDVCETLTRLKKYSKQRAIEAGESEDAGYCNHCGLMRIKHTLTNDTLRKEFLKL